MARRNIQNQINEGRNITKECPGLDLNTPEIIELIKRAEDAYTIERDMLFNAVSEAYLIGLSVGMKNASKS